MAVKKRTHQFILTITTNKACTSKVALREARDTIHGEHYCTVIEDDDPEKIKISSIRHFDRRAIERMGAEKWKME